MAQKQLSWRDLARSRIETYIEQHLETDDLNDPDFIKRFKILLREKYTWGTSGWPYQGWLKERKIAIAYLEELKEKGEMEDFRAYSLARLGNRHHLARTTNRPDLVAPGQLTLL